MVKTVVVVVVIVVVVVVVVEGRNIEAIRHGWRSKCRNLEANG